MKFKPWKCPECKKPAKGVVETVPGIALLNFDCRGNAERTGETELRWDDQRTETDEDGRVDLYCPNGHSWQAEVIEG